MSKIRDYLDPTRIFYSSVIGFTPFKISSLENNGQNISSSELTSFITSNQSGSTMNLSSLVSNSTTQAGQTIAVSADTVQKILEVAAAVSTVNSESAEEKSAMTLSTIGPEVQNSLTSIVKTAVSDALSSSGLADEDESMSLVKILRSLLSTLNVNVTNDGFEELLQKLAYRN